MFRRSPPMTDGGTAVQEGIPPPVTPEGVVSV